MKIKDKIKSKLHSSKKLLQFSDLEKTSNKPKMFRKFLSYYEKNKKTLLIILSIIILFCIIIFISISCLVYVSFDQKTYQKATVLGVNVGNLNKEQLSEKLIKIENDFKLKNVSLKNDKSKWNIKTTDLGLDFDVQSTIQAVWKLNNLSLINKFRLIIGSKSSAVEPVINVDNNKCIDSLSGISIPQINPTDAHVFFDKDVKIRAEKYGTKFSAVTNCKEIPKQLSKNIFSFNIFLDNISVSIIEADLEPKLSQIKSMVGKSLTLKSEGYQLDLTPEQLITYLEISKKDSKVQVNWSNSKLDELMNTIASKVDTNNNENPRLGSCQYVENYGGNWLDKDATKKIFSNLTTNSSRTYTLPINYHEPTIGNRTPVSSGSNGTVYLTFDDGMTYANQIMDYASCYGVKVTFFELGSRVGEDSSSLVRAISEGHAVQSHGFEHAAYDYGSRSYDWQKNDMAQSISAIMSVTGVRPTYFRPPGGNRSDNTYSAASANGLTLILWGVSSTDTVVEFGSDTICSNVVNGAFSGASVLMHSTKQKTADAVPCIIEGLAERGFNMQALR